MPGLSGRMSTIVRSKISKLLDRAEDPGETLEYSYQKQIELLQNVKKGIADVVTSKKRLQLQEEKLRQQVVKLDTQARQALAQGNEELARMALERKNVAKTENMKARAGAVQELEAAGTFEDLTALGSGDDDIDRQLKQLSSSTEVDAELEKMKAEVGSGSGSAGELGAGGSGGSEGSGAPA